MDAVEAGPASILEALRMNSAVLRRDTLDVADFVNVIAESKPLDTLRECGVRPEDIATPLSFEPAGPVEVSNAARTTKLVIVRGGRAPYAAHLVGADDTGIGVSQTEPFGPAIEIAVPQGATPGTYSLLAVDQAGRRKALELVVTSAEGGEDNQEGGQNE